MSSSTYFGIKNSIKVPNDGSKLCENVVMEADSGVARSIICEQEFKKLKAHQKVVLEEPETKHVTCTGGSINVLRKAMVPVKAKGKTLILPLLVVANKGSTLMAEIGFAALEIQVVRLHGIANAQEGRRTDPCGFSGITKVYAIPQAPAPTNKEGLQSFLDMVNFSNPFLKEQSKVAEVLHRLLDNGPRRDWTPEHQKAFYGFKQFLFVDSFQEGCSACVVMRCVNSGSRGNVITSR